MVAVDLSGCGGCGLGNKSQSRGRRRSDSRAAFLPFLPCSKRSWIPGIPSVVMYCLPEFGRPKDPTGQELPLRMIPRSISTHELPSVSMSQVVC